MIVLSADYPSLKTTYINTGTAFERGVPRPVTDEEAAVLLAVNPNKTAIINGREMENPNFGKPLNPELSLYEETPEKPDPSTSGSETETAASKTSA